MKPEIKTELENFLNWLETKVDFIAWSKHKGVGFDILQEYEVFRKKNVKLKHYVNCYFPVCFLKPQKKN